MGFVRLNYEVDAFLAYMQVKGKYTTLLESGFRVKDTGDHSIIVFNPKTIVTYQDKATFIKEGSEAKRVDQPVLDLLDELIHHKKPLGTGLVFNGGYEDFIFIDHVNGLTYICTDDEEVIQKNTMCIRSLERQTMDHTYKCQHKHVHY